jgi:hypothetical protein
MEVDLFLLDKRIEAACLYNAGSRPRAIDVEDLIAEVDEVSASFATAAREAPRHSRAARRAACVVEYLAKHKEALQTRLRELERMEAEDKARNDYIARVAQREREIARMPVDRGKPAYARGA